MLIPIIIALLSSIFYSIASLFQKKISTRLKPYENILLTYFFIFILTLLTMIIFENKFFIYSFENILILLINVFFGFFGMYFLLKSFEKKLKFSQIFSLTSLSSFFVFIFYILFENKKIFFIDILFIILIFIGINLILDRKNFFHIEKNFLFPFFTAICWGIFSYTIYLLSEKNIGIFSISFHSEGLIFLTSLFYIIFFTKINYKKIFQKKNIYLNFFNSLFIFFGILLIILAF